VLYLRTTDHISAMLFRFRILHRYQIILIGNRGMRVNVWTTCPEWLAGCDVNGNWTRNLVASP